MRRKILGVAFLAMALCGATGWSDDAQENKDAAVEKALGKIAQLGPGVHAIKKDKQGRITSCIAAGQARVSTVLGKAKGLQDARDKARLDASGQFVKWLKEQVTVCERSESEVILFMEGSEDNDQAAIKESGKSIEKTSKRFGSASQGLVRGLQVLHVEVSGKDKTYTILMGWSAASAKAIEGIGTSDGPKSQTNGATTKKNNKKIEDQKLTSDDAKKFLP
jgi:hypothetical protein